MNLYHAHWVYGVLVSYLRQCQQVDDQVFNTHAYMSIEGRTADLPPSLKALKNVDISESGCSFHSILILIQDFPISKNNLDQHWRDPNVNVTSSRHLPCHARFKLRTSFWIRLLQYFYTFLQLPCCFTKC